MTQGGVTPTDSIARTATIVGQWSTVKAAQKGAVNGQSTHRRRKKTGDRSAEQTDMYTLHVSLRATVYSLSLENRSEKGSSFSVTVIDSDRSAGFRESPSHSRQSKL